MWVHPGGDQFHSLDRENQHWLVKETKQLFGWICGMCFSFDFWFLVFLLSSFTPSFCSVMYFCLVKVSVYLQTCEVQQTRWEVWEWSALPGNSRKHFRLCFYRLYDARLRKIDWTTFVSCVVSRWFSACFCLLHVRNTVGLRTACT